MEAKTKKIGKCIICGSIVEKSQKMIKTEDGICHQGCALSPESGVKA